MNEKEVAELRRRFRPDRSGVSHVRGCYVNENREIVSRFDQPLGVMTQEENEKLRKAAKSTPLSKISYMEPERPSVTLEEAAEDQRQED